MKSLHNFEQTVDLIKSGEILILAGEKELLGRLPAGNWIAGTISYFMGDEGGTFSHDLIHVIRLSLDAIKFKVEIYDEYDISHINDDAFENGFSVAIMPAASEVQLQFALKAPRFHNFGVNPLIGWISGVDLKQIGIDKPVVMSGLDKSSYLDKAVVMHVELPDTKFANVKILNLFEQDENADEILFLEDSFTASHAVVNGKPVNFVEYLKEKEINTKWPLVVDYNGNMGNVAYQLVGEKEVRFYAPVFKSLIYKQAKPMKDYVKQFDELAKAIKVRPLLSFNCILNYLYGELEGKTCGYFSFPCTFGEIAYQLFTQTLVYLEIHDSVER